MPNEKKYIAELAKSVNSPSHYTQGGTETIDLIKEATYSNMCAGTSTKGCRSKI